MLFKSRVVCWLSASCLSLSVTIQSRAQETVSTPAQVAVAFNNKSRLVKSVVPAYFDLQTGVSVDDLIRRAMVSNLSLSATRLEIEKAKARLRQAGLRPNPTLEFEQESGRLAGDGGDGQLTVGFSLPIEIFGRRIARISAARTAIEASEAEVRDREREVVLGILSNYADALLALRELEATEELLELDLQTTQFVQVRVNEGETPPLELNLLQAEVERLRSRKQLSEGKLQSALTRIKLFSGIPTDESLLLRERIEGASTPVLPVSKEAAVEIGLRTRPDVQLARIAEQVATAGLRLVRAESRPDLTAYTRFSTNKETIESPLLLFSQRGNSLTFGVAVGLPIFNKSQGAKAEAEISIRQAQARREFAERVVRSEIISAFQRFEAANRAVLTLQTAAIPRSLKNVETFRRVYELGEIKVTDLIAEQRRLIDVNRDLTEALSERYRAQVDLNIAIGAGAYLPEQK